MKKWDYFELCEAIEEVFKDQVDQGMNSAEAVGITFENFYSYPEEDYKVQNFVVIAYNILLKNKHSINVNELNVATYYDFRTKVNNKLIYHELNSDEARDFISKLKKVEIVLTDNSF